MDWKLLKNNIPNEKTWCVFREDFTPEELAEYDIPACAWNSSAYAIGYILDGQIHSWWTDGECVVDVGYKATQNWLWRYVEA
jgi:hypothetical protein